jgi:gluconolactonase
MMGTGFAFTEGPVWDRAGFLWVSDEKGNKIDKLYPDGHIETVVSVIDPDGSTYDRQHRLWSTSSGLRAVIEFSADGKSFEVIADQYQGKKLNTPNDIVTGPDGAIYFTDPIIDLRHDQQQEQPQSIYRIGADHSLTLLTRELLAPNGLAFSPDGKYLYIDDDKTRKILRYDFHKDGTISGGTVFGTLIDPGSRGNPDGMRVDKHGRLFVSGPNGMWVFNRDGKHLGTVQMPHPMANLAWGGPGYSRLYITAGKTVYILQTKTHGFIPYENKK